MTSPERHLKVLVFALAIRPITSKLFRKRCPALVARKIIPASVFVSVIQIELSHERDGYRITSSKELLPNATRSDFVVRDWPACTISASLFS